VPWTGILRRQASPRLPIPSGFALDLWCRHSMTAVSGGTEAAFLARMREAGRCALEQRKPLILHGIGRMW
jgi:hypothetical protein